jgi:hypothetical protein
MPAPAYTTLGVTIPPNILQATLDPGAVLGPAGLALPIFQFPNLPAINLTLGTAVGNLNILGVDKGTLVATTRAIDLTAAKDPYGNALNFAKVLALLVWNFATTAGNNLLIDGTVANAFSAPFNGIVTAKKTIGAAFLSGSNVIALPDVTSNLNTGFTVSGTNKVVQLDAGAFTIPYLVAILGISA